MIRDLVEMVGRHHSACELVEFVVMDTSYGVDEVVESNGGCQFARIRDATTLGCRSGIVNPGLSMRARRNDAEEWKLGLVEHGELA